MKIDDRDFEACYFLKMIIQVEVCIIRGRGEGVGMCDFVWLCSFWAESVFRRDKILWVLMSLVIAL